MIEETFAQEVKEPNITNQPDNNEEPEYKGKNPFKKIKNRLKNGIHIKKPTKKQIIIIILCIIALAITIGNIVKKINNADNDKTEYKMLTVQRMDIQSTVDGSSVIEANDTYDVTALVQGEILADHFEEGDIVKKDQLLYEIDSEDAARDVQTAKNKLIKSQQAYSDAIRKKVDTVKTNTYSEKAQQNAIKKALNSYDSAVRSLEDIQNSYNNLSISANYGGVVEEVLVSKGDNINVGTKIAKVCNTEILKIQLPFNESDANNISVGEEAILTIASSGDKLTGVVDHISGAETATNAHAVVKYVTINVTNPGGLTINDKASAMVGEYACSDIAAFEYSDEGYITAKSSGTLNDIYLEKNDLISVGQNIGSIESDTITKQLEDGKDNVETSQMNVDEAYDNLEKLIINNDTYSLDSSVQAAKLELDDSRLNLEQAQEKLEDYQVKAPIDGTIITKNKKSGDKLETGNSSATEPMAVIYDMSTLKVQLSVDETDIRSVKAGQDVTITADAVNGTFTGKVTKVGVNGTSENGVTTYPVDITINEYGDLLPGMNVDCVIVVESAENVLAIESEGLQRGNVVYVAGEKTEDNDKAPEGYRSVKVETGINNSTFVEIKSGLKEGDTVCGAEIATGVEASGDQQNQNQMMGGEMGGMHGGMSGGMPPGGSRSGGGNAGGGPR